MKKLLFVIFMSALFGVSINAQTPAATATPAPKAQAESKPKRQTFRANKEQITQAQKMMKATETGKMDDDFRAAVKKYQSENGLSPTGSLNRATLEKMNIALTDKQKEIPVSASSMAGSDA